MSKDHNNRFLKSSGIAEHYYKKNYKLILVGGTKEKVDKLSKKI